MELYILKSAACLAILFSFYKLFLENESMHKFKRFYLLGALIVSFSIPLVTFTTYVVASVANNNIVFANVNGDMIQESTNFLAIILWTIYGTGVVFFSLKFFKNLRNLLQKIKLNPKVRSHRIINVLLNETITPHTFFSYIFLNKQRFEDHQIPKEVLIHEETHALQKHSFDILLIELVQITFWFNPFVYLVKRSIKLNHEFLADNAVLREGIEPAPYQNLLLSYSSSFTQNRLANSINYSSIKKRFTLMKTKTSQRSIMLRALLILPLVALLLYGFSTTEIVTKTSSTNEIPSEEIQKKATKAQVAEYNKLAKKYNDMPSDNMFVKKKDVMRLKHLYGLMSDAQRKNAEPFPKFPPMPPAPDAVKSKEAPDAPDAPKAKNVWVNDTKAPPPPPPPAPKTIKNETDSENGDIPPPPPIVRLNPIDHIVRMVDENAAFFYENKSISSHEAVALFKKNSDLHMQTTTFEKSNPIVKISESPLPPPPKDPAKHSKN